MGLWLIDGHEKGDLPDCLAKVFHISRKPGKISGCYILQKKRILIFDSRG
jgi:hypothetical protein